MALSWLEDETTDLMEQFIGIVRGRTVNSTRGRQHEQAPAKRKKTERDGKKPAARKSAAKPRPGPRAPNGKRGKPRRR